MDDLLRAFKDFSERVDAKFSDIGKGLGRLRERVKSEEPAAKPEPSEKASEASVGREDHVASVKLGRIMAGFSEAVQARIEKKLEAQGASAALEYAESLREMAAELGAAKAPGNSNGEPATGAKTTRGAPPAPRDAPQKPKSQVEYLALKKSDPKRFEALQRDNDFDPSELPVNPSRFG